VKTSSSLTFVFLMSWVRNCVDKTWTIN